jgi:5-methylcytosine-specific restriction endonuclease McrA
MSGPKIPLRIRFLVLERDGFTCQFCGARPPAVMLEIDHFKARKHGGGNEPENLITTCSDCNRGKGDLPMPTADDFDLRFEILAAADWTQKNQDRAPSGEQLPAFLAGWLARAEHGR